MRDPAPKYMHHVERTCSMAAVKFFFEVKEVESSEYGVILRILNLDKSRPFLDEI